MHVILTMISSAVSMGLGLCRHHPLRHLQPVPCSALSQAIPAGGILMAHINAAIGVMAATRGQSPHASTQQFFFSTVPARPTVVPRSAPFVFTQLNTMTARPLLIVGT